MGEVRSPGQGLQSAMPERQPWAPDFLAPDMSTSLGPPFTLHNNGNRASHCDVDIITPSSYPTLKGQGYGVIIMSPVHRKVDECQ